MTAEQLLIALIRIAGSLPVLRWPFYGALLAILIDLSDLFWMEVLDLGGLRGYQSFDKRLDLVYMATFLAVALRWRGRERAIAVALFVFRMLGVAAFEVTGQRTLLLAFPNVFEFWYVLIAARDQFAPKPLLPQAPWPARTAMLWLIPLTLAKLAQEYLLHFGRWLDRYSFFEFWAVLWRALTPW